MIPDDLFWVVGRTGRVCGVFVFLLQVGDGSEPISGKGVGVVVGWEGRESVAEGRGRAWNLERFRYGEWEWGERRHFIESDRGR